MILEEVEAPIREKVERGGRGGEEGEAANDSDSGRSRLRELRVLVRGREEEGGEESSGGVSRGFGIRVGLSCASSEETLVIDGTLRTARGEAGAGVVVICVGGSPVQPSPALLILAPSASPPSLSSSPSPSGLIRPRSPSSILRPHSPR